MGMGARSRMESSKWFWAVMEWECVIKSPEQGAREGAKFIADHIIEATQKTFDDFAGAATDPAQLKQILGL